MNSDKSSNSKAASQNMSTHTFKIRVPAGKNIRQTPKILRKRKIQKAEDKFVREYGNLQKQLSLRQIYIMAHSSDEKTKRRFKKYQEFQKQQDKLHKLFVESLPIWSFSYKKMFHNFDSDDDDNYLRDSLMFPLRDDFYSKYFGLDKF